MAAGQWLGWLALVLFLALIALMARQRYRRHAARAAERSQSAMIDLITQTEAIAREARARQDEHPADEEDDRD